MSVTSGVVTDITEIQVVSHEEFGRLTTYRIDEEIYFLAQDVCAALGLRNVSQALSALDEDEKTYIRISDVSAGTPKRAVVNLAGTIQLCVRSTMPQAKPFRRWVTHEVVPTILRTGMYIAPTMSVQTAVENFTAYVTELATREAEAKAEALEVEVSAAKAEAAKANVALHTLKGAKGGMTITEAARYITAQNSSVKTKDVFATLRANGIICKRNNAPTQYGIRCGYVKPAPISTHKGSDGTPRLNRQYALLTTKGVAWLAQNMLGSHALPDAEQMTLVEATA